MMQPLTISFTLLLLILLFNLIETIELKTYFSQYVQNVASAFHENWRRHFLLEHPNAKNRFKLTHHGTHYNSSDFIYPMILTVGSCLVHRNLKVARNRWNSSLIYVDILNMKYEELPADWSYENRATARVACREVLRGLREQRIFNADFIENVSQRIHMKWMKRNKHRTHKQLLIPYENLPEIEKDKDRRAIVIACELFNQLQLYHYFQTSPIDLLINNK